MVLKVLSSSKEEIELEVDNLSVAEILRVYLNKDEDVTFAAWRRSHPTKNPVLLVRTKGKNPKKSVEDAVKKIDKDLEKLEDDFKKLK